MWRGRFQLGEEVPLAVLCADGAGAPYAPTEAPTAAVFTPAARVKVVRLPALDRPAVTGLFGYRLFLGAEFTTGLYRVEYRYRGGGNVGVDEDQFEVVAGGNADGAVVALHGYLRPHALFLVHQLDSGRIARGKNPRL